MTDANARRAQALRSPAWVHAHLWDPNVRIVDGSFHVPGAGRDPRAEFDQRHIPGATFFDVDGIRDIDSGLPHMLPSADAFARAMTELGIGSDDLVIAYDAPGSAAAPRVWWTFRVFGHENVAILDGGLGAWIAEGRPVDAGPAKQPASEPYVTRARHADLVRQLHQVRELADGTSTIVDNRSPGRFGGSEPEPRPSKHQGHIPGSVNIPFQMFVDPDRNGVWRSDSEISDIFASASVDPLAPMVSTCGSGVTACTTTLAAWLLGSDKAAVYDGSWAEWGNRDDTPIAT